MNVIKVPENGNGLYKTVAVAMIAAFLGMGLQMLREPKDIVTDKEMNLRILELQGKIDGLTSEVVALRSTANQEAVDISSLATKLGVTAHPVIAPH